MKAFFVLGLLLCPSAIVVPAQELLATIRIFPEDVVQSSIKQISSPGATNRIAVFWQYSETGAKKMLAFRQAHAGEKVTEQVGDFEFHPIIATNKPPNWTEEGWLKSRTDKFFSVSLEDAKRIVAGFKGK